LAPPESTYFPRATWYSSSPMLMSNIPDAILFVNHVSSLFMNQQTALTAM